MVFGKPILRFANSVCPLSIWPIHVGLQRIPRRRGASTAIGWNFTDAPNLTRVTNYSNDGQSQRLTDTFHSRATLTAISSWQVSTTSGLSNVTVVSRNFNVAKLVRRRCGHQQIPTSRLTSQRCWPTSHCRPVRIATTYLGPTF